VRPARDAIGWIHDELGPGARVVRMRPLRGGVASVVHEVTVARGGSTRRVVLRRYEGKGPGHARLIAREAAILEGLAGTAIPAPRVIAVDPRGERAGEPALLMEKLPGRVLLVPADREAWLRELARHLAAIHDLTLLGEAAAEHRDGSAKLDPPAWSTRRDLWARALDVLAAGMPAPTRCRLHGDYQHFNLLWSRGRIEGILDWVGSGDGPFELDVGHCRLNLAVLFSADVAERFRELYEAESGRTCDPRWDLAAMTAYLGEYRWPMFIPMQVAGRAPVDVEGMDARVERLVEAIVVRT
jgi:aminoglycoside phosphotransferase (APT) family kinase protein